MLHCRGKTGLNGRLKAAFRKKMGGNMTRISGSFESRFSIRRRLRVENKTDYERSGCARAAGGTNPGECFKEGAKPIRRERD